MENKMTVTTLGEQRPSERTGKTSGFESLMLANIVKKIGTENLVLQGFFN
jgi:hypothetical protein